MEWFVKISTAVVLHGVQMVGRQQAAVHMMVMVELDVGTGEW